MMRLWLPKNAHRLPALASPPKYADALRQSAGYRYGYENEAVIGRAIVLEGICGALKACADAIFDALGSRGGRCPTIDMTPNRCSGTSTRHQIGKFGRARLDKPHEK